MRLIQRFCRRVTRMILERADRRLGPLERLVVRVHLSVCPMCTRFTDHVHLMNRAMGQWKAYADAADPPPG